MTPGRRVAALAAALALAAGACIADTGSNEDSSTRTPVSETGSGTTGTGAGTAAPDLGPNRGGTLRVLLAADPTPITGWTPWGHTCAWSCRNVLDHVIETLTIITPDGSVVPWLAESVQPGIALDEWTVKLRPNIRFTDGQPLDANAVKLAFDSFLRGGRASGGHVRDARIQSVRVFSELTLVFLLSEPNAGLPAALAGPLGRVFSTDAAVADPEAFAAAPVGTGPFTFSSWTPDESVVLEANPNYWRRGADGAQLPFVDEIVFSQIVDERERLDALIAGQGDVLMSRSAELAAAISGEVDALGEPLTVLAHLDDNAGAVLFNLRRAPLDDVRVRRALVAAADPQRLIAALGLDEDSTPASQWFAPASVWHTPEAAAAWPQHDPALAAALLGEYANDARRSDDRQRGDPLRIRVLCTDDEALLAMTEELKRQWEATGLVDVDVEAVARTGLIARVMGSVTQSPSFAGDFAATCWRVGGESDPTVLATAAVGPIRTTPLNVGNLDSERLTELAALIASTWPPAERRGVISEFMLELAAEVPYVLLSYAPSVVAGAARVTELGTTTLPSGEVADGQRLGVGRYDEVWLRRE